MSSSGETRETLSNANAARMVEITRQPSSTHRSQSAQLEHSTSTSSRATTSNTSYPPNASSSHRLTQNRIPRRPVSSGSQDGSDQHRIPRRPVSSSSRDAPEKPLPMPRSSTYNDRHQQSNMPHAVSKTVDRVESVADFSKMSRDSPAEVLKTLADSHLKIVEGMTGYLAEVEMRLGIRTLAIAQANIRMENLRLDISEGKHKNAGDLNVALAQELYHCMTRMEQMCIQMRQCNNHPPSCQCQYSVLANQTEYTDYKIQDCIAGYPIQEYLAQCEQDNRRQPSRTLRAIYDGLCNFFRNRIGPFDPNKPRCQSIQGFLEAWRTMVNMPTYLEGVDQELSRMQTSSAIAKKDGVHKGKPSRAKRLSGLFTRRPGSRDSDASF